VELAHTLAGFNIELISTGGTAQALREAGLAVTDVSAVTGFPEMLDGRVKTLHPKIHGGILAVRDNDEHRAALQAHDIAPVDLVVINLYPFEHTISQEDVTLEKAIENIDIGGPALIRSAAKNWRDVAVVTSPDLYGYVAGELRRNDGALSAKTRAHLAHLAFMRTAAYDATIFTYLEEVVGDLYELDDFADEPLIDESIILQTELEAALDLLPEWNDEDDDDAEWDEDDYPFDDTDEDDELAGIEETNGHYFLSGKEMAEPPEDFPKFDQLELIKATGLRYGENPHQKAALYHYVHGHSGLAHAMLLNGKEMSYNNYVDADAAWQLVCDFADPTCAIIKHTNPSGVGQGATLEEAYHRALATDPVSAFGGIVAFCRPVTEAAAVALSGIFTEVVVAPGYDDAARAVLARKKNLRVLQVSGTPAQAELQYHQITGGFLVQTADTHQLDPAALKIAGTRAPTAEEMPALLFAWTVCKHVKSNAIVLARAGQTLGVGAGQMNRLDSVRIAAQRAQRHNLPLAGAVLASDAFFPFRDGVDEAAQHGITAVIQPGGSVRDSEVIQAANEHGLAMIFTNVRHFRH
jgi:phosphoribosylaminoimidazolecarboxamide formyltransferase/IMP cyclohydrolase